MRRPAAVAAGALSLALLAAAPAVAQHPNHAQGFRPEHLYDLSGIENVNLFNGNLTLTIPIGGSYPLGPELSYGLTLTWTGNLWEWEETEQSQGEWFLQAAPRARSNAGFGWELSLGRMIQGTDPGNPSPNPAYMGPDQALHELFHGPLHTGGQSFGGVFFSRDGTYLRRKTNTVESPDGTIRTFSSTRLDRLEDRFGHYLEIAYSSFSGNDPLVWDLTDSHDRSHRIEFAKRQGRLVVKTVRLATFGTQADAVYTFTYDDIQFPRACNEPILCSSGPCGNTSDVTLPVLVEVGLPDGSSYKLPKERYYKSTVPCTGTGASKADRMISGHPTLLELPTGGAFEYEWREWRFPKESGLLPIYLGNYLDPPLSRAAGIAVRRHLTRSGSQLGTWTYSQALGPQGSTARESVVSVVPEPLGEETRHYFSVWPGPADPVLAPGGWTKDEYGLPFSRDRTDGSSPGRFLSQEVYSKTGAKLRSTYVRYETGGGGTNPRVVSQRTVYHDDNGRRADVDFSGFDGLGHHRTMTMEETFLGGNTRTTTTNWNPGRSASNLPGEDDPWVLDTYDTTTISEGGQTVTREYAFDSATGFLRRTRIRKGAARGEEDLVVVRTPVAGFVDQEDLYGGDGAELPTNVAVGALDLSGETPVYRRRHDYACGVLKKSLWSVPGGADLSFSSPDLDIDCDTGLVAASRDTAGLKTTFSYDRLGRITEVTPQASHGAAVAYRYDADGTNGLPARVTLQETDGSTVLTEQQVRFDGFGRVAHERRKMPDGTFAVRETDWNSRGWIDMRSEWEGPGDGERSQTLFRQYDPFGRPGEITLPDGEKILISYSGDSSRTVTVRVANATQVNGGVFFNNASTTETYDRFGRLAQVHEPNGTPTHYSYDALGNLTQVRMNAGRSPQQLRSFFYDHRGFLLSEVHPELDTTIVYSDYDPLGNPGRIERGGWDLDYDYDAAGRLLEIRDHDTSGTTGLWKQWLYATANGEAGPWSNGKLKTAIRHNRVFLPGSMDEIAVPVTEDYAYGGVGGRVSTVTTTVGVGSVGNNTRPVFELSLAYDLLGNVTSRTYPDCSHLHCETKSPDRTIVSSYTEGLLTAITNHAPSIAYHPNGLVRQVIHGNGVIDVQENDPDDLQRPYRLRTIGASTDFDTGRFGYDGAGNLWQMGTSRFTYDRLSRLKTGEAPMVPDSCTDDGHVQATTYSGASTLEACGEITTGPGVTVSASGDLTFRAGDRIVLGNGFRVDTGGRFVAAIDPGIEPVGGAPEATWVGTYDLFGNLEGISTQRPGQSVVTRMMPAVPSTNRLDAAVYDKSGNVISWFGRTYRYDPFNMLRETGTHIFLYGPGDERIWTIDWSAGTADTSWVETWTLRDLDGSPLRQMRVVGGNHDDDNWTFLRDYVWRGGALLSAVTPAGTQHFHLDHLGTPRLVTDAGRNVLAHHSYFPFGEEATYPADATTPLHYTGHERDDLDPGAATTRDLDYMHARYFSAHLGRFHSVDPAGASMEWPQSWNRYSYVLGNPLRYVDPEGEFAWEVTGQIGLEHLQCLANGGCEFTETVDSFDPMTGVAGLGSLVAGRALVNGLQGSGGRRTDWITTTANISAGIGDALLLGFGDELRGWTDRTFGWSGGGLVDRCSDSYQTASVTTTTATAAVGGGRLLYAGSMKGLSMGARLAGTEAAALRAAQARDTLKVGFRLGLNRTARIVPPGERLARRGSAAALARSVGKTNPRVNAAGAGALAGSVNSFFNLPNCGDGR